MFKFKFSSEEIELDDEVAKADRREISWKESKEIEPSKLENLDQLLDDCDKNSLKFESNEIKYVSNIDVILQLIKDTDNEEVYNVLKAEECHSDLLPGVYEGGLKIWECTYDIANFIEKEAFTFEEKKVLDLGCGAGIVGILAILKNARCYFQDYNEEVLKYVTIPNVAINCETSVKESKKINRYFSGDWSSFSNLLKKECPEEKDKFDYIFTCETIYNPENYKKLHDIFKTLLKIDGIVYLAAKSYYFGVGGGLSDFKDFLGCNKVFKFQTVWNSTGSGLEREILEIKFVK